jgi:hypothetical protein
MSATDLSLEFEPQSISDVGSDIGATLTVFNEKLYAGWKGSAGDTRLWYSSFDGRAWDPQQSMPEAFTTSHGPSLATFHNAMYAAFKGTDTALWWSLFDGSSWEPKQRVRTALASRSPGLAVYRGALHLAYKGAPGYAPDAIWWTPFDGVIWNDRPMSDLVTSERPALAVWGEGAGPKLVMVYKGNGSDEAIYYSTLDGYTWAPKQHLGGSTDSAPSVVNYRGHLYAAWKEAGDDERILYSTFDGNAWATPKPFPSPLVVGPGPSLAVFNEQLYVVWRGWDTKLWWART